MATLTADCTVYEEWRDEFARQRLRALCLLGLIANPVFFLSDLLFYQDVWTTLLALRIVIQTGLGLLLWAVVRRLPAVTPQRGLISFVLIGALCIAHMTVLVGGFFSPYYNGLNLIFLAAAVMVPVSWRSHLSAQAVALAYYYSLNLLHPLPAGAEAAALQNLFFLAWTCVACLFAVHLYEKLQVAEFQARLSERRAREELERSHQQLLELDRLKDQFFANINHELRTPLTVMLGAFRTLLRSPVSGDARPVIEAGLRNTSRLLFLINELLELARFDSGRAELRTTCVDVASLITNVAANFAASDRQRIVLEGVSQPVPAQVDVRKMTSVFSNLFINAFKFSDPEKGCVWASLASTEEDVSISIRDNGIGIPEDQFEHIFDRFTQVEGQATRRYEGSGIGLALAKEIVQLHGGRIAVQSRLGEGSTFTVTWPRGPIEEAELSALDEEAPLLPAAEGTGESLPLANGLADRPLVLVADDNADMRAYLVRLLAEDYRVVTAVDGREAWQQVHHCLPAVVVADIMMPNMSGLDLLREIRSDERLRATSVILVTARTGSEAQVTSLEAGADDYLSKPFNEEELLARIKNQLRIRQQEHDLEAKATQLQELTDRLEAANHELRDVSRRKSEFVSIVSHDLRTPLAAIAGFVDNLLDEIGGPLTEKQRRYAERIKSNVDRLVRMITDLLDLAKIEAGTVELACKSISIANAVDVVVENLQGVARDKGVMLRTVVPSDKGPLVRADPDRLAQILTNLVQNACKFTAAGGEVRVEVDATENGFVRLCVVDTGCGIPPEEAGRVFDKFYRGTTSREGRGAGLGLAIAKHFVDLHQGEIWVESVVGQGSRFYVTLPVATTPEAAEAG